MRMLKPAPTSPARRAPQRSRPSLALAPVAPVPGAAPAAEPQPAAVPAAAAAPLRYTQTWFTLVTEALARRALTASTTASVIPLLRADTGAELIELQFAVIERLHGLQQDWWQGWSVWIEEFAKLKRADTLSEHMEQQYNLMEQFTALLKSQATDLVELQDNVEVNYGYWATRKLEQRDTD